MTADDEIESEAGFCAKMATACRDLRIAPYLEHYVADRENEIRAEKVNVTTGSSMQGTSLLKQINK